ncbi:MAG: hypothetical protein Q9228_007931, partial [Teloschistes exilis]
KWDKGEPMSQNTLSTQHVWNKVIDPNDRFGGYLSTHEIFFLLLDPLPLFLGVVAYTYFWPAKYIGKASSPPEKSPQAVLSPSEVPV